MRTSSLSITSVCLLIALAAVILGASDGSAGQSRTERAAAEYSAAAAGEIQQVPQYARLKGRWQRPDGGYILEIKDVTANGTMDAAYFNPSPIRVANAQALHQDGELKVVVELRDVNYPGSTYNLTYDPMNDRLKGAYYQAVARETYRVFFLRVKP